MVKASVVIAVPVGCAPALVFPVVRAAFFPGVEHGFRPARASWRRARVFRPRAGRGGSRRGVGSLWRAGARRGRTCAGHGLGELDGSRSDPGPWRAPHSSVRMLRTGSGAALHPALRRPGIASLARDARHAGLDATLRLSAQRPVCGRRWRSCRPACRASCLARDRSLRGGGLRARGRGRGGGLAGHRRCGGLQRGRPRPPRRRAHRRRPAGGREQPLQAAGERRCGCGRPAARRGRGEDCRSGHPAAHGLAVLAARDRCDRPAGERGRRDWRAGRRGRIDRVRRYRPGNRCDRCAASRFRRAGAGDP